MLVNSGTAMLQALLCPTRIVMYNSAGNAQFRADVQPTKSLEAAAQPVLQFCLLFWEAVENVLAQSVVLL